MTKAPSLVSNELQDFRKTRLYELLKYLKPKQREKVLLIGKLEFSKTKENHILLLEKIILHMQKSGNKPLLKNDLLSLLSISNVKINYVVSEVFKKVCKILYFLNTLQDYEQEHIQVLANFFANEDLDINIDYALEDLRKALKKKAKRTKDFHYYQMKYHELHVIKNKKSRKYTSDFKMMVENLDAFYAENKLRFLCEEMNRTRIINQPSEVFISNDSRDYFLKEVKEREFFGSISVEINFYVYKMFCTNSEEDYQHLADIVQTFESVFSPSFEEGLVQYLRNQCIYFINKGINRINYAKEYLEHLIRSDKLISLLSGDDKFSLGVFQNIVYTGLITGQKKWGKKFVYEIYEKLDTEHKEFMKYLHLALIDFENGAYDDTYAALRAIDEEELILPKDDIPFVLLYYKLYIQVLFKSYANKEAALNKAEALRKYSKRCFDKRALGKDKHVMLTNFTLFFRRVAGLSKKAETYKWEKLKQEFDEKRNEIAYSDWLATLIVEI